MQKSKVAQKSEKPLYLGHRARLRARFLADYGASMPDYEMLELLLTIAIPRRDVKPLAKRLIEKFGDLNGVIKAPVDELLNFDGVSENTAALIKIVHTCGQIMSGASLSSRDNNSFPMWTEFVNYCCNEFDKLSDSDLHIYFFNDALLLIKEKIFKRDNINFQELIQDIISLNATQIALVQRHFSKDNKPDKNDIDLTKKICDVLMPFEVRLIDHIIFSDEEYYSFLRAGLLPSTEITRLLKQKEIIAKFGNLKKTK